MAIKKIISYLLRDLLNKISSVKFQVMLSHVKKIRKKLLTRYMSLQLDIEDKEIAILLDLDDKGITTELLRSRIREKDNVSNFVDILKKNNFNLIVDIGANIGFFVLIESSFFKGNIVAVEPVKRNFNILMSNIYLNHLEKRITPLKLAIGDEDTVSDIHVHDKGNWSSLVFNKQESDKYKSEKVNVATLSTLFSNYKLPKENLLLRCDIEGYEYNLVKGNKDFLKDLKNVYLIIEFHTGILKETKSIEFINLLKDIGFEPIRVIVDRPHYLESLPKSLNRFGIKLFEWATEGEWLVDKKVKNIHYNDLIEFIRNSKHIKTPHIYFYKR